MARMSSDADTDGDINGGVVAVQGAYVVPDANRSALVHDSALFGVVRCTVLVRGHAAPTHDTSRVLNAADDSIDVTASFPSVRYHTASSMTVHRRRRWVAGGGGEVAIIRDTFSVSKPVDGYAAEVVLRYDDVSGGDGGGGHTTDVTSSSSSSSWSAGGRSTIVSLTRDVALAFHRPVATAVHVMPLPPSPDANRPGTAFVVIRGVTALSTEWTVDVDILVKGRWPTVLRAGGGVGAPVYTLNIYDNDGLSDTIAPIVRFSQRRYLAGSTTLSYPQQQPVATWGEFARIACLRPDSHPAYDHYRNYDDDDGRRAAPPTWAGTALAALALSEDAVARGGPARLMELGDRLVGSTTTTVATTPAHHHPPRSHLLLAMTVMRRLIRIGTAACAVRDIPESWQSWLQATSELMSSSSTTPAGLSGEDHDVTGMLVVTAACAIPNEWELVLHAGESQSSLPPPGTSASTAIVRSVLDALATVVPREGGQDGDGGDEYHHQVTDAVFEVYHRHDDDSGWVVTVRAPFSGPDGFKLLMGHDATRARFEPIFDAVLRPRDWVRVDPITGALVATRSFEVAIGTALSDKGDADGGDSDVRLAVDALHHSLGDSDVTPPPPSEGDDPDGTACAAAVVCMLVANRGGRHATTTTTLDERLTALAGAWDMARTAAVRGHRAAAGGSQLDVVPAVVGLLRLAAVASHGIPVDHHQSENQQQQHDQHPPGTGLFGGMLPHASHPFPVDVKRAS